MEEYLHFEEVMADGSIPEQVLEYAVSEFAKQKEDPAYVPQYRPVPNPRFQKREQEKRKAWAAEQKLEKSILQLGEEIGYRPPPPPTAASTQYAPVHEIPSNPPAQNTLPPIIIDQYHPLLFAKHPHNNTYYYIPKHKFEELAASADAPQLYLPQAIAQPTLLHYAPPKLGHSAAGQPRHRYNTQPQTSQDYGSHIGPAYASQRPPMAYGPTPYASPISHSPKQLLSEPRWNSPRMASTPYTPHKDENQASREQAEFSGSPATERKRIMPPAHAASPINPNPSRPQSQKYADFPAVIALVVQNISDLKKNDRTNLPSRQGLKASHLGSYFDRNTGFMRKDGPLYQYYGDVRLFTMAEWKWLVGMNSKSC